jgi:fructokinase
MSQSAGPDASPEHSRTIVGLGELLWDLLPEGPRLGGAPANFAVMAGRLGNRSVIASRLGSDQLAADARAILETLPVDLSFLQTDAELPTGSVEVAIENGEARYNFRQPVAWDRLAFSPAWQSLAEEAHAVCFGTLAQRDARSQQAILAFLDATPPACVRVFDVNLRVPFRTPDTLRESLMRATIVKMNAGEVQQVLAGSGVCPWAPAAQDQDELLRAAHQLLERYAMHLICVTLGGEGSLLVTRDAWHRHPGFPTTVRDTVGAGDAFTAALTHYYLDGAALPILNEAGNCWGAWIASQTGAMPPLEADTIAKMAAEIRARRRSG